MAYYHQIEIAEYNSNEEYRDNLRKVFQMNYEVCSERANNYQNGTSEIFEKETIDELEFDEEAVQQAMDYVYERTREHELFTELYKLAAGKMISLDLEIGMSICFSYDYFKYFHDCLSEYLENPEQFNENKECYKRIKSILT